MESKTLAPEEEKQWAKKQVRINDVTTGLTAAGATALGAALAGKTKLGKKVLSQKMYDRMRSSQADDIRNTIALASMAGGAASGVHWAKKLRSDAEKPPLTPRQKAANIAAASKPDIEKALLEKGISTSTVVRGLSAMGLPTVRVRRASYRRRPLPRARLRSY